MFKISLVVLVVCLSLHSYFVSSQSQNRPFENVVVKLIDLDFNEEIVARKSYANLNSVIHNKELFALRIKDENIPIIYQDSVTDVKRIRRIELENDNITKIQPGAFGNLTRVFISLKNNLINEIEENVFSGLAGITGIDLEHNNISAIHERAFANMTNLTILILNNNQISRWSTGFLLGSPVSNIFISNNFLKEIPIEAFQHLNSTVSNHYMEFMDFTANRIEIMKPGALEHIKKIDYLYLGKNKLKNITVQLFQNIESIKYLSLKYNSFNCLPKEYETMMKIIKRIDLSNNPVACDCADKLSKWSKMHKDAIILPHETCVKVP